MGRPFPAPPGKQGRGKGFPIPGKPRLPSIQPQNNPWAGRQPPAPTLLPKAGRRQCARGFASFGPPCRPGIGWTEKNPSPWGNPTAGLPSVLPAGTRQRSFLERSLPKIGGDLSLGLICLFFLLKIIIKNLKQASSYPTPKRPVNPPVKNLFSQHVFCSL